MRKRQGAFIIIFDIEPMECRQNVTTGHSFLTMSWMGEIEGIRLHDILRSMPIFYRGSGYWWYLKLPRQMSILQRKQVLKYRMYITKHAPVKSAEASLYMIIRDIYRHARNSLMIHFIIYGGQWRIRRHYQSQMTVRWWIETIVMIL